MKMFEPSQSLWRSRRQEPPCLPVQEQSAAVLALAERCYRGLPRKPADAAPAALTLHELRVQRGTESWWFAPAPGRTVMGLCLRLSYSQSPAPTAHPSHLPTQVQVQPHSLFPSSFLSAQTTHTKVTSHPSLPSRFLLTEMLCDSFSVYLSVLDRGIPWKQRYFTEVPFTARKPWYPPAFTNPERARNTVQFVQT